MRPYRGDSNVLAATLPATMTPSKENDWAIASDGFRARKNGAWGKEKLSFLDEFGSPALVATAKKHDKHYVDLFAGPGRNVVPETFEEFEGSAIRALQYTAPHQPAVHFTSAFLVNKDPDDQKRLLARGSNGCELIGFAAYRRMRSNS